MMRPPQVATILATVVSPALAQLSFPLVASPLFDLLSGDDLVSQQLLSWGVKIGPISVDLDLDVDVLGAHLGRSHKEPGSLRALSRSRTRGLNLGVDLKGDTKPPLGTTAIDKPSDSLGIALPLTLDLPLFGWGEADNVARGERGDTEWYTYITIGSPPQRIPVLPDTGSSDLFVFGPTCSTCSLKNHTAFNPNTSSSFRNLSTSWELLYADNSGAKGYASSDSTIFGGRPFTIPLGIATEVKGSSFTTSERSGVMGLGLDPMALLRVPKEIRIGGMTYFSRLVRSGVMKESVLSIRVEKGLQSQGKVYREGGGAFTFGGIEDVYITGGRAGLGWVNVTSSNYWGFGLDDISVGQKSILVSDKTTSKRAIIDTGTTLIITSNEAAKSIHSEIIGSFPDTKTGIWYIPCNTAYPASQNVFFTIGGRRYGIPVQDLAWKKSTVFEGSCVSGIQGGMPHFTVLGSMFIKNHYVVLSYGSSKQDNIQVGLGDRIDVAPIA